MCHVMKINLIIQLLSEKRYDIYIEIMIYILKPVHISFMVITDFNLGFRF